MPIKPFSFPSIIISIGVGLGINPITNTATHLSGKVSFVKFDSADWTISGYNQHGVKLCIQNHADYRVLFSVELKPRGYYLEHFCQADMGYIGQAIIGVKVPNSSHVACIQHGRVGSSHFDEKLSL